MASSPTAIPTSIVNIDPSTCASINASAKGLVLPDHAPAITSDSASHDTILNDCAGLQSAFADEVGLWMKEIAECDSKTQPTIYSSAFGGHWRNHGIIAVRAGNFGERLATAMESPAFYVDAILRHTAMDDKLNGLLLVVEPNVWDSNTQVDYIN
jgi:hypothetical protein